MERKSISEIRQMYYEAKAEAAKLIKEKAVKGVTYSSYELADMTEGLAKPGNISACIWGNRLYRHAGYSGGDTFVGVNIPNKRKTYSLTYALLKEDGTVDKSKTLTVKKDYELYTIL